MQENEKLFYLQGFGSRIMAQMGYVHGSGLGVRGNGKIEPVSTVILPSGKSLGQSRQMSEEIFSTRRLTLTLFSDHCMMLRESAVGDSDLLKAEKKIRMMQKKQQEALARAYQREKERTDVFTFLNNQLGQSSSCQTQKQSSQKQLKEESTRGLNVTSLQLEEEVRRTEKEIKSLNQSLTRLSNQSQAFAFLKGIFSRLIIYYFLLVSSIQLTNLLVH